ncbi:dentin sialophosphoprotein-like [Pecten maximus]|uniref:dentin sialophosphoprotein-like n=1 Tax=Pecten maximus TaxID=6579 RepID=UPI00145871A8|nr:dentin sialophosphoprotein-like [Pecten maximus]
MESTLTRPRSPEIVIEEDTIMPQFLSKEPLESVMPRLFSPAEDTTDSLQTTQRHLQDSSSDDSDELSTSENKDSVVEMGKDLDFSLNMTSDPSLFSTPFPKRNTKETESGMSYDISVQELDAIESDKKKSLHSSGDPKGGIAYVIRDDVVSGVQRTINYDHNTVSKSMSYAGTEQSSLDQKQRTGSLKDINKGSEEEESDLDWSGKRLVRSELFSDIPQNDSVSDWTEQKLDDEGESTLVLQSTYHDNSVTSSEENLNDIDNPRLMRANIFRARENLANLSDNSDSMILTSESTSHSESSTPPPPYTTANGENDVALSPETTPTKTPFSLSDVQNEQSISTDLENNEVITNVISSKFEVSGNGGFNVALSTSPEHDTDC